MTVGRWILRVDRDPALATRLAAADRRSGSADAGRVGPADGSVRADDGGELLPARHERAGGLRALRPPPPAEPRLATARRRRAGARARRGYALRRSRARVHRVPGPPTRVRRVPG